MKKTLKLNKLTVASFNTSLDAQELKNRVGGGYNGGFKMDLYETPTMVGGSCRTVLLCCVNIR